jgi:hypothetical protein
VLVFAEFSEFLYAYPVIGSCLWILLETKPFFYPMVLYALLSSREGRRGFYLKHISND